SNQRILEQNTGFEPATPSLGRLPSTLPPTILPSSPAWPRTRGSTRRAPSPACWARRTPAAPAPPQGCQGLAQPLVEHRRLEVVLVADLRDRLLVHEMALQQRDLLLGGELAAGTLRI